MSQFRPISLCNVVYKIIAKVLVNRISVILGDCINEAQGAFIPERLISDNVLIAYEVFHSLKMKKCGKKGNFALKLDMMSYSICLNGMSSDWFSPSRGLRQGDPLSPYLFLICAESFSTLLEDAKHRGCMGGAPFGRGRFSINHLLFVDDCILFGDATHEGARTVSKVIREYELSAGQGVNYDKSLIYFSANVSDEVKEDITSLLGVRVASNPEKYLGLPMMVGRRKTWAFANFIDRFRKRVEGWSLRYLSMGVQPQYLLAIVLKARYFPFTDILAVKVGSYPSFTWRSICGARELIEEGVLWRIGKGDRVNIWNDPLLHGRENNRVSGQEIRPTWTTVNQLIEADTNTWNRDLIRSLVDEIIATRILSIPISESRTEDTLVWKYEGSGDYTVKSGYRVLATSLVQTNSYSSNEDGYKDFYKALWSLNISEKTKIHNWRLFNNLLPHFSNLARRLLSVDTVCLLCKVELEDANHLLWSCGTLQGIWSYFQVKIPDFEDSTCCKMRLAKTFSTADEQQKRIIAISSWSLWYRRNKLIHGGIKFSLEEVLGFIWGFVQELDKNKENLHSHVRPMKKDLWRPPDEGVIKINFDASFQRDNSLATTAVIARDSTGEIIGAETYFIENVVDSFVAEARVCERALIFATSMGF
ncbi:reverse transcriptase [Gossypium australe]|uniref:Reverse transcriptase n=1 Tax=Gossypium australe TaxID=47621 RepID=A0A5B6X5F8_9ROSI|nr:reverse transcriptase [Gossypium australe]